MPERENRTRLNGRTSLVIGMSIYRIQSNTLKNLEYLNSFAFMNPLVDVYVFDKSAQVSVKSLSSNFHFQQIPVEDLCQTMCRIELESYQHILWVNDDDEFSFKNIQEIESLGESEVGFPNFRIKLLDHFETTQWDNLFESTNQSQAYLAYLDLAVPVFFSAIPSSTFKLWKKYVSTSPIRFSHLDTQLSILLSITNGKKILDNYNYYYDASNWTRENVLGSLGNHLLQAGLAPEIMYFQNFLRKIENLAFFKFLETRQNVNIEPEFFSCLLNEFRGLGNGKKNWIWKNLAPKSLQRVRVLSSYPSASKEFYKGKPTVFIDTIIGVTPFHSIADAQIFLADPNIANLLLVPQEQIDFWRGNLESK
jgi:hypothetical protein